MFCHRCGNQVADGITFCPHCGQALGPGAALGSSASVAWTAPTGVHSRTGHWIGAGWEMVKQDFGTFFLLALVVAILNSVVPFLLVGPLFVGFHIFCMKKMLNRRAEFADLFKGFNFFVPALVASLLIGIFSFAGTLLCIIPGLVVAAMYKFTYLFIVDKGMDFWPAMQASHAIVKQDYFGFTMFLLALIGVNILGGICCIIGIFISIPVTVAAITVAYREIVGFDERTVAALGS
ncbi:MAG TPA: zinc-ribbon domain-containing protein [Candidatus Acidoferrum sp.]|nr:zinc-ribbon domain-containing protein [Candidatus Acidoferrum sp.]